MMKLFCIHGSFQTPSVWEPLANCQAVRNAKLECVAEDLNARTFDGFEHWSEDFCQRVESSHEGEQSLLLGYSMGGRLALHACLRRSDLWKGVVVVGADPGFASKEERSAQARRDRSWSQRVRKESLKKLADEWDAQSVFCGIENRALRNLDDLDPENLSRQFDVFSKARQRNLVPDLAKLENPPILFLSGEEDLKYGRIGEELAEACSAVQSKVLRHAGHRAPWENPESFVQVLIDFAFG